MMQVPRSSYTNADDLAVLARSLLDVVGHDALGIEAAYPRKSE